ncbi:EAL domain-containing protein [Thiotrichales bacterium 19S9-12]|nr:EAL domain-containing protein [Thiotrichales bacterium 19S9-11]MCF6812294.1 EAL domain-containing protein [Thiotrichales bacterium 19S9-12]
MKSEYVAFNSSYDNCLTIDLQSIKADVLANILHQLLTPTEKENSISCHTDSPDLPGEVNLINGRSLNGGISKLASNWLIDILKENRILMHYQPVVNKHKNIIGYEALLRAKDCLSKELIYPNKIFDLAKHSELLFYLDRDARVRAIKNIKNNFDGLKLFINFNPSSIYDPTFCLNTTFKAAEKANVLPHNIVFEIIETEKIHDFNYIKDIIVQYKAHGFKIALDDVGSGYNSLNSIINLKPDIVKIDMQLVRNIENDNVKQVIVKRLVEICNDLNIKSLAEGVETELEYQYLKSVGLEYMQGYFFGKPAPFES